MIQMISQRSVDLGKIRHHGEPAAWDVEAASSVRLEIFSASTTVDSQRCTCLERCANHQADGFARNGKLCCAIQPSGM
jgi:hypothetical protein